MGRKVTATTFLKSNPRPVILHFQPTHFEVLKTRADLARWEKDLIEKVGLKSAKGMSQSVMEGTATGTCTYNPGDCDED